MKSSEILIGFRSHCCCPIGSKEFMIGGEPVMDPLVIGIETIEHDKGCIVSDGHNDGRNRDAKCT